MPLSHVFDHLVVRTRNRAPAFRYAGAVGIVLIAFGVRYALDPVLGLRFPLALGGIAVLATAVCFGGSPGIFATGLTVCAVAWTYLDPVGSFWISQPDQLIGLITFAATGILTSLVIETLHKRGAHLRAAEQHRAFLLREFRHRARNDLQSLVGLLLLRARGANPEAKEALREAAGHARALANVHRRLEVADADERGAYIESATFIKGLVSDLDRTAVDGLRPVALRVDAENHTIDTERAVTLGLVLNELVTNALKYAFPDERHGTINIKFRRNAECFELVVDDDGIGLPPDHDVEPGSVASRTLGTRLLRGLAAQLRGGFRRGQSSTGGTRCVLSFAADAPSLHPQAVGT